MKSRPNFRSSHRRFFAKKGVLRKFAKFTRNTCLESLFKYRCRPIPATLLKKRLWNKCFPVNFAKFLRTPFLQNTSRRLLLKLIYHKGINQTNLSILPKLMVTDVKWPKVAVAIAGDSMMSGIRKEFKTDKHNVKVRFFKVWKKWRNGR